MTTKTQTFYCSATDWHMARAYSDVSLSYKNLKEVNHRWYVKPLIVFVGSGIGSIIHMHWIWLVGIIISFPLFLITYQRHYKDVYQELLKKYEFAALTQQKIPYITLDEHHLVCHFFRPDGSGSHYIKLDEIDGFAIHTLSNDIKMMKLPVLINKKARSLGAEVIPELYTDKSYYVLWIYSKSTVMKRNTISIPKQWFNEAAFAQFLSAIERKTGKKLQLDHSIPSHAIVINYLQHYTPNLHK